MTPKVMAAPWRAFDQAWRRPSAEGASADVCVSSNEAASWFARLAWLLILLHVLAAICFYFRPTSFIADNKSLGAVLNITFVMGCSFAAALLAARSHLAQPFTPLLFIGGGALAIGYAGLLVAMALLWLDADASAAINRSAALLSAACHLAGAAIDARAPRKSLNSGWLPLLAVYLGVTVLVGVLVVLIRLRLTPVFFVPGVGATPICAAVTTAAALGFAAAAYVLSRGAGLYVAFRRWYSYGLYLFAASLMILLLKMNSGDALNWIARSARFFGSVYLLIACVIYLRNCGALKLPVELALWRSEEELRSANERLALALRAGRAGFFDWSLKDEILFRSPELEALLGLAPKARPEGAPSPGCKAFPGYKAWTDCLDPPMLDHVYAVQRLCAEQRRLDVDFELSVALPGGGLRWLGCRGQMRYSEDGRPERMIGVAVDVTDRKRAEAEAIKLNHELEQRVAQRTAAFERINGELEAFAYSVSHDLRIPLRAIDGFSQVLLDEHGARFDDAGRRRLNAMRASSAHMGKLIDDLLNYSCLLRRTPRLETVDVAAAASRLFTQMASAEPGRDIRFTMGAAPSARCDRALIHLALEHLLANAICFTASRSPALIEIAGSAGPEETVYAIKDNGVGFDMKDSHKLFGVFQRPHKTDEFAGAGVGLALVKRVMELHGGRVWAEGAVGEGATICFALPNAPDQRNKDNG
jgi:signal transduction histidine kinase